jgi:hypothetical protein
MSGGQSQAFGAARYEDYAHLKSSQWEFILTLWRATLSESCDCSPGENGK